MNIVILSGRLGRDPETKYTANGKAVTNFVLAVDRGYGDNRQTSWINCVAWEKTAETIANTLCKGRKIAVTGEWVQRTYDKDDKKKSVHECLIRTFEYGDSKQAAESGAEQFGSEVFTEEEIGF
ncbi:MAG TPA: single-stranded DNA-binding protein [Negativicutes bacterium]